MEKIFMSLPTVVFITALPLESDAITKNLSQLKNEMVSNTAYRIGVYPKDNPRWRVVVREAGQTNTVASTETILAIRNFEPDYIFLVGTAGGIKDVALGDVVIADVIKGYERGKDGSTFEPRGAVARSSYKLVEVAKLVSYTQNWCAKIDHEPLPKALIGVITTGEKVVASTCSPTYKLIRKIYSDAIAVEMEGIGFSEAVWRSESMRGIVIRGISDLLDDKDAKHDKEWQPIAAENAAAFAFAMLDLNELASAIEPLSLSKLEPLSYDKKDIFEDIGYIKTSITLKFDGTLTGETYSRANSLFRGFKGRVDITILGAEDKQLWKKRYDCTTRGSRIDIFWPNSGTDVWTEQLSEEIGQNASSLEIIHSYSIP